jgi:hypothetical protein
MADRVLHIALGPADRASDGRPGQTFDVMKEHDVAPHGGHSGQRVFKCAPDGVVLGLLVRF